MSAFFTTKIVKYFGSTVAVNEFGLFPAGSKLPRGLCVGGNQPTTIPDALTRNYPKVLRCDGEVFKVNGRTIVGDDNLLNGDDLVIYGNRNLVSGARVKVYGDDCWADGRDLEVHGDGCTVKGDGVSCEGRGCTVSGTRVSHADVPADLNRFPPPRRGKTLRNARAPIPNLIVDCRTHEAAVSGMVSLTRVPDPRSAGVPRIAAAPQPTSVPRVAAAPRIAVAPANQKREIPASREAPDDKRRRLEERPPQRSLSETTLGTDAEAKGADACIVCAKNRRQLAPAECRHPYFCYACVREFIEKKREAVCPICKKAIRLEMTRVTV